MKKGDPPSRSPNPHYIHWDTAKKEKLQAVLAEQKGKKRDWPRLLAAFPGTSRSLLSSTIRRLGLAGTNNEWTQEELQTLKDNWGCCSTVSLVKKLPGRTLAAVQGKASELGLGTSQYKGLRRLAELARDPKWGFSYATTRKMLDYAGVRLYYFIVGSRLPKKKKGAPWVPTFELKAVAEKWLRREEPGPAAVRLGVGSPRVFLWLELEGKILPKTSHQKLRTFYAEPAYYDSLKLKYEGRSVAELRSAAQEKHQQVTE